MYETVNGVRAGWKWFTYVRLTKSKNAELTDCNEVAGRPGAAPHDAKREIAESL